MPYKNDHHRPSAEELRARIPGWGADLDPADRPSVPRERSDLPTGAHWEIPESQVEHHPRERSIEHLRLTPVFGTVAPLHGLSGTIRRFAYKRFSEARAAHWLLLVLGDRVDVAGSRVRSVFEGHPDNVITETGILGEIGHHPIASRFGRGRADLKHVWLDPFVAFAPVAIIALVVIVGRRKRARGGN
ncbi:MAG: hypothetical protein JWQ43_1481 [Glaciihabitans sp.]|nr:hypothetical protein [Glaciihabitans sp.]